MANKPDWVNKNEYSYKFVGIHGDEWYVLEDYTNIDKPFLLLTGNDVDWVVKKIDVLFNMPPYTMDEYELAFLALIRISFINNVKMRRGKDLNTVSRRQNLKKANR